MSYRQTAAWHGLIRRRRIARLNEQLEANARAAR